MSFDEMLNDLEGAVVDLSSGLLSEREAAFPAVMDLIRGLRERFESLAMELKAVKVAAGTERAAHTDVLLISFCASDRCDGIMVELNDHHLSTTCEHGHWNQYREIEISREFIRQALA